VEKDHSFISTSLPTSNIIVALVAQQARRPDLIRSPKRVLAHTWDGF